ncbi:fucolectin-5-like [Palaemon carinicauda]|uniref:fucolectin-5-like n=1 Tax=Palaemon carinicauda TaxID=392227 RepID=UPI0035B5A04B
MNSGLFLSSMIAAAMSAFSPSANTTYYVADEAPWVLTPSHINDVLTTVLWPDFLVTSPVQVKALSNVSCSFRAMKSRVATFAFEENTCSLFGSEGTISGQVSFYRRIPSPLDGSLEEVARGKLTNSSGPASSSFPSEKAVDGLIDGDDRYMSLKLVKPWWWVDLEEERIVYQIQIYPRQNWYPNRFHDVEVRVGNTLVNNGIFSSYTRLCTYEKEYSTSEGHLLCTRYSGVSARYVSIHIVDAASEHLQINEVSVYALKM